MEVQLWMAIPFAVMLLLIAVAPLLLPNRWESNKFKLIATAIITVPASIMLIALGLGHAVLHQVAFDYIPFIMLLLTLFVVTGGIHLKGDLTATPGINASILAMGYFLASLMGTTGAAMLLIRFLLETNRQRQYRTHTVLFFIAMVILSFAGNLDAFLKCVKYIFLIVFIHNLLALGIGFGIGTTFKVPRRDRRTLTIETGIQNSGLGLVLLLGTSIFAGFPPHGGMLVITAWWGIWHIISGLTVSTIFNLKDKRAAK